MIISASYRSDIPAFYGDWFLARLEAGFCRVTNPYGGRTLELSLARDVVDGFLFWTRNVGPFLPILEAVAARGYPFVVHHTITGYPRALEPSVIPEARALALVRELARRYGPRAVVWRYDPILITSLTPPAWHRARFEALAGALVENSGSASGGPVVDEVVLSFAQIYAKTKTNCDRAAKEHGFTWEDPPPALKQALLAEIAGIAAGYGLRATLCAQPDLMVEGLSPASCVDAARFSDLAGYPIEARTKGNRPGCLCAESRDLGAYDTCPHGCVYCYAVRRPELAKQNHRRHDPTAERLIPAKEI